MQLQRVTLYLCLACVVFTSCAGPDYMPDYFGSSEENTSDDATVPTASEGEEPATGSCTVSLTSTLCVAINGEAAKVGVEGEEPLCIAVDPIPLEINSGTNIILRGEAFPDIPFEGHGLPAPIVINGKGTTDGKENVGTGKVDKAGNIIIEDFSFFINALGMVGEVPDLILTTGATEELDGFDVIEGEPLGADGHVKFVAGTVIGHLFPAADEKLYGSSLQAVLEGTISPPLSECKGEGTKPQSSFVTKLVMDEKGGQTEALLPGSNRMETGEAFIAQGPQDIGPLYEASARFKIVNATSKPMSIDIPAIVGAFYIEAAKGGQLKQDLPSKTPLIIKVTFKPTGDNTKEAGPIEEMLTIGPDIYQLTGSAAEPSGEIGLDVVDESGKTSAAYDSLNVGDVAVSTVGRREFFSCRKIVCNGIEKLTQCVPCVDVLVNVCQLVAVDGYGNPAGVVDNKCKPINKGANDFSAIGLGEDAVTSVKMVFEIKNNGVKSLQIKSVAIQEIQGSKSSKQFRVSNPIDLPATLAPFDVSGEAIQVVVIYEPDDLLGFDGGQAVIGHKVKDKAVLRIVAEGNSKSIEIFGTTVVKKVPALQVYFKSATGMKEQPDGSEFSFRGITSETADLAVPVFIKLSDSATGPIRITKLKLISAAPFEWLDTREKIDSRPEGSRCSIPVFDAAGGQVSTVTDLKPVSLLPDGFDLKPGDYNTDNMPLFGCVNFRMGADKKRQYAGKLIISTLELANDGSPARNADGSLKQTDFGVNLLAVVNPLKGKVVFRLTQTIAAMLHSQFSSISASPSADEMDYYISAGHAKEEDRFVMPGAMILDPFDEEIIKDEGGNVVSGMGDGITAVYRRIDTHPVNTVYDDNLLPDYTSLISDASGADGGRGVFFDYPNVPENLKLAGLRMYTAGLSYPGPLALPSDRPENVAMCEEINPCDPDEQKKLGTGPTEPGKKGVCAFFYGSVGSWDSLSFHRSSESEGGLRKNLCESAGEAQKLKDLTGSYKLNGGLNFEDSGLRLWGPNYFSNPAGPLGNYPPMDAVVHLAFTTDVLAPKDDGDEFDKIPDKRVNAAKQEYKINLNDSKLDTPQLCEESVKNRLIGGEYYSTWKFLKPFLVKDKEGTIKAGCPEQGEPYTGGSAFLRGRPLDQETGAIAFVGTAKFESDKDLTFAFQDVMFFIALNGWFCDPEGPEEQFEGSHCFDMTVNERDRKSTVSIMK